MLGSCWRKEDAVTTNLKNVEKGVQMWKFQNFNQVLKMKREIMQRIHGVQRRMQNGIDNIGIRKLENKLQQELHDIMEKEELMWFQRSRSKWLADGDRNTK